MDTGTWKINCKICKEYLRMPTTLPCGHMQDSPFNKTTIFKREFKDGIKDDSDLNAMHTELKLRLQQPPPQVKDKTMAKEGLREILCVHHKKILNQYCLEDEKCICEECNLFEHRKHDAIPAGEERRKREQMVEELLLKTKREIHAQEFNLQKISNTFEYVKSSSQSAVEANERLFTEMIANLETMKSELNKTIREQEKALLSQVQLEERQQRGFIMSLQAKMADLKALSQVKEDIPFIKKSQAILSQQEADPVTSYANENMTFDFVKMAISKVKLMVEDGCKDAIDSIQKKDTCPLTLDPDTAHPILSISEDNAKVSICTKRIKKKSSPQRFDSWEQVLCKEGLKGGCFYWEVEWSGKGVYIGVALENFPKKGKGLECGLGHNVNSWCLHCSSTTHSAWHNGVTSILPGNILSPRLGIYLDYKAGSLEFYTVSHTMTFLHRFTLENISGQLYPAFGFGLGNSLGLQSGIKICRLEANEKYFQHTG
ncbi:tripartite motif-containing protein 16-like [Salminus brasiliensis]|uniref:tripartite motif-containing protein 16-like n=1 Tax=Salminus brasiliensis TaxID=930266 RepID=UPI003B8387AF